MQVALLALAIPLVAGGVFLMKSRKYQLMVSQESYDEGDWAFGRGFKELAYSSLQGAVFLFVLAAGCAIAGVVTATERPMYKWEAYREVPKHHEFGSLPSLEAAKTVAAAAKVRLGPAKTKVTITTPAGEVYVAKVTNRNTPVVWEQEG